MKTEKLSGWTSIVANVGVIGGLALLAYELNQNTQMLRAQAISSQLTVQAAAETAFMGEHAAEAFSIGIKDPAELSDAQISVLWAYLNVAAMAAQETFTRYELGLATEQDRDNAIGSLAFWVSFPFGRAWWEGMKPSFPVGMGHAVDVALAKDPNGLVNRFEGVREAIQTAAKHESPPR